jgi:hypothetical protein
MAEETVQITLIIPKRLYNTAKRMGEKEQRKLLPPDENGVGMMGDALSPDAVIEDILITHLRKHRQRHKEMDTATVSDETIAAEAALLESRANQAAALKLQIEQATAELDAIRSQVENG